MRKIVVITLIVFSILLLGVGITGAIIGDNEKKQPQNPIVDQKPVVPNTKKISCMRSEFGEMNAMVDTTIEVTFNESNMIDIFKTTTTYSFNDFNDYNNWKMSFESNGNMGLSGVTSSNIFNDTNMNLISVVEQKYSEMLPENINYEYPNDYEGLKNYLTFGGYYCTE